jgi:rSAM/selenodomain-associated transferase 1
MPSEQERKRAMSDVLGVFAKAPRPGQVKTRLAAATNPDFAARVAAAFLHDTVTRLQAIAAERHLVYAPDNAAAELAFSAAYGWLLTPQGPGDLGARMERFIQQRLGEGAQRVVLIGADSPTLPLDYVTAAYQMLDQADVVLAPAFDGGYCLLGIGRRLPPIFDGIAWGTSSVLRHTVARLDASWRLELLPPWYDLDTLDDWEALRGHVAALRRAGIDPAIPLTEALLQTTH